MKPMRGQRWAITGAAGNLGVPLREALASNGVDLISIDIRPTEPIGLHDRTFVVDLADLDGLTRAFEGCHGVIHLGGIADEADFHDLASVNIIGTYHVLEAARRAGAQRVVFASSNRLTGFYDAASTVSVDMPPRPDGFYGVSKVAGEALCRLYSDKFALSTIAVRIGSYEQRPGSPREQRTWLSPQDAVRAFTAAMTTQEHVAVFYGVSANGELWWDTSAGTAIGYAAQDDALRYGPLKSIDPDVPQGGFYATAEYSLDRMRP